MPAASVIDAVKEGTTGDRTLENPITTVSISVIVFDFRITNSWQPVVANPKTIIVLGETGARKSSLVNMRTGRQAAPFGDDAVGVTFTCTKYSADLFDTKY